MRIAEGRLLGSFTKSRKGNGRALADDRDRSAIASAPAPREIEPDGRRGRRFVHPVGGCLLVGFRGVQIARKGK